MTLHKCVMNTSITILAALLMCAGTTWAQGEGPAFNSPAGIVSDGGFNLLIVDEGLDAVVQVEPPQATDQSYQITIWAIVACHSPDR